MKTRTKDQAAFADTVFARFLGDPRTSEKNGAFKLIPRRIIESAIALEDHGIDWVSVVRSERFLSGNETVARIIAYPNPPEHGLSEVRTLLARLGLEDRASELLLFCGHYCKKYAEDDFARAVWVAAADIAEQIRAQAAS